MGKRNFDQLNPDADYVDQPGPSKQRRTNANDQGNASAAQLIPQTEQYPSDSSDDLDSLHSLGDMSDDEFLDLASAGPASTAATSVQPSPSTFHTGIQASAPALHLTSHQGHIQQLRPAFAAPLPSGNQGTAQPLHLRLHQRHFQQPPPTVAVSNHQQSPAAAAVPNNQQQQPTATNSNQHNTTAYERLHRPHHGFPRNQTPYPHGDVRHAWWAKVQHALGQMQHEYAGWDSWRGSHFNVNDPRTQGHDDLFNDLVDFEENWMTDSEYSEAVFENLGRIDQRSVELSRYGFFIGQRGNTVTKSLPRYEKRILEWRNGMKVNAMNGRKDRRIIKAGPANPTAGKETGSKPAGAARGGKGGKVSVVVGPISLVPAAPMAYGTFTQIGSLPVAAQQAPIQSAPVQPAPVPSLPQPQPDQQPEQTLTDAPGSGQFTDHQPDHDDLYALPSPNFQPRVPYPALAAPSLNLDESGCEYSDPFLSLAPTYEGNGEMAQAPLLHDDQPSYSELLDPQGPFYHDPVYRAARDAAAAFLDQIQGEQTGIGASGQDDNGAPSDVPLSFNRDGEEQLEPDTIEYAISPMPTMNSDAVGPAADGTVDPRLLSFHHGDEQRPEGLLDEEGMENATDLFNEFLGDGMYAFDTSNMSFGASGYEEH